MMEVQKEVQMGFILLALLPTKAGKLCVDSL